jgi:hypothetical protein
VEQGQKTMEQTKQKIGQALEQQQQRASQSADQ